LDLAIVETPPSAWKAILDWMERHEEHGPDLADAQLVALAGTDASLRIWSYDQEFSTIWRRTDGSRVPTTPR